MDFLSQSYATPAAILISATSAIVLAIVGWFQNRKLAKETAALALILQRTRELRSETRGVNLLLHRKVDVVKLANHLPEGRKRATWQAALSEDDLPINQKQYLYIARVLGFYEALAIAIAKKIVDEETVKRFLQPRFCYHTKELYPYISVVRTNENAGDEETWIELEELARRWGVELPEPPRRYKNWREKLIHNIAKRLSNRFSALVQRTAPRRR